MGDWCMIEGPIGIGIADVCTPCCSIVGDPIGILGDGAPCMYSPDPPRIPCIPGEPICIRIPIFEAHRLSLHSTLRLRIMKKQKDSQRKGVPPPLYAPPLSPKT